MTEVPCYVVDLSAEQMKILNIALNKIQGEWDYQKLQSVLIDLPVDMQSLAGFSGKELEKIMFLFSEDNINIMEDDRISGFERDIKNHEIRILIPKDYEGLGEIKSRVMILKQDYPDIIIKEVM
jgi:ParB-like chromosome segregation protein Spo0J